MNEPQPFVSVVIPVMNDFVGISRVLDAIIHQTYPRGSYEIIVADNGSTDNTLRAIAEFKADYPGLVRSVAENWIASSYVARNRGLKIANGSIIAFTDSDCLPADNWIEAGVEAIQAQNADCVAGCITFTFRGNTPNLWEYIDASTKLNQRSYVEDVGFGATANLFVRRAVFEEHGDFREDLSSGGDYEFGRRISKEGAALIYAEEAIVFHPARATARENFVKARRLTEGQLQLHELGLMERREITWRRLVSSLKCPSLAGFKKSKLECIVIITILILLRLQNLFWRQVG